MGDSIYVNFKNRRNHTKVRAVVPFGGEGKGGIMPGGHEGNFLVLVISLLVIWALVTQVYGACENSLSWTLII